MICCEKIKQPLSATETRAPLIYAARDDCVEMVKLLLAAGADANTEDNDGMTPLDHAEQRHRTEVPVAS